MERKRLLERCAFHRNNRGKEVNLQIFAITNFIKNCRNTWLHKTISSLHENSVQLMKFISTSVYIFTADRMMKTYVTNSENSHPFWFVFNNLISSTPQTSCVTSVTHSNLHFFPFFMWQINEFKFLFNFQFMLCLQTFFVFP